MRAFKSISHRKHLAGRALGCIHGRWLRRRGGRVAALGAGRASQRRRTPRLARRRCRLQEGRRQRCPLAAWRQTRLALHHKLDQTGVRVDALLHTQQHDPAGVATFLDERVDVCRGLARPMPLHVMQAHAHRLALLLDPHAPAFQHSVPKAYAARSPCRQHAKNTSAHTGVSVSIAAAHMQTA